MKTIGNFDPKAIEAITDEEIAKAERLSPKEIKVPTGYEGARYIVQGTGLRILVGQWTWYGPGCNGDDYYVYNVKPGAWWQDVGTCPNGRYLYIIDVV